MGRTGPEDADASCLWGCWCKTALAEWAPQLQPAARNRSMQEPVCRWWSTIHRDRTCLPFPFAVHMISGLADWKGAVPKTRSCPHRVARQNRQAGISRLSRIAVSRLKVVVTTAMPNPHSKGPGVPHFRRVPVCGIPHRCWGAHVISALRKSRQKWTAQPVRRNSF